MKNDKKIIHVIIDDKFIDMALREFEEVAPGSNLPIIIGRVRPLLYVKSKEIKFCSLKSARALIGSSECSAVVFHSLWDLTLLSDIPRDKKVVWLGWGYDYYNRLLADIYPEGLALAKTNAMLCTLPKQSLAISFLEKVKYTINIVLGRSVRYRQELLSRVDIFSPVLDVEFHMACKNKPWFNPQYITWNYGTVEDDLAPNNEGLRCLGDNILVGNSATFENNHLEVFEALESYVNLTGRKIIVPLSYGNEAYKRKLVSIGREKFGDKFVPLQDFMNKDDYIDLLQSCGYVFMNHIRQQALGNICIMMLKGAKIYMNPASPLYQWMLDRSAVIESIEVLGDASGKNHYDLEPLSKADQINNIQVIQAHWSRKSQRDKTRRLVDLALNAGKG